MAFAVFIFFALKVKSCHTERQLRILSQPVPQSTTVTNVNLEPETPSTPTPPPTVSRSLDGSVSVTETKKTTIIEKSLYQDRNVPRLEFKGLNFMFYSDEGGPHGIFKPTRKELRGWYVLKDGEEMQMIPVAKYKRAVVSCEGPVVYDMIITEKGKPSSKLRIKHIGDGQGRTWDWQNNKWGELHPFSLSDVKNISGIRIIQDKDDPTPIVAEIGLDAEVKS